MAARRDGTLLLLIMLIMFPLVFRARDGTWFLLLLRDRGCGKGKGKGGEVDANVAEEAWKSVLRAGAEEACC